MAFVERELLRYYRAEGQSPDQRELNAALAVVDGIRPEIEVEGMLAVQMAATHSLARDMLARVRHCSMVDPLNACGSLATKLLRTYAAPIEALKRYRSGDEQNMTVQHVHVAEGAQAIVGNVNAPSQRVGRTEKRRNNLMLLDMHQASRCRATSKRSGLQCRAPAVRGSSVCRMHGACGGPLRATRTRSSTGSIPQRLSRGDALGTLIRGFRGALP
jgi:hypothetical protein